MNADKKKEKHPAFGQLCKTCKKIKVFRFRKESTESVVKWKRIQKLK